VEVESKEMGNVQLDEEGGVAIAESKSRFVAPAIALMMASRAGDDGHQDPGELAPGQTSIYRNNLARPWRFTSATLDDHKPGFCFLSPNH